MQFPEPPQGHVRLGNARMRLLSDGPRLWAAVGGVDVADFVYETVDNGQHGQGPLGWLRTVQPDFAPGPYDQLVAVYRDAGEEELAEKVLLEKQRRRHAELSPAGRVWGDPAGVHRRVRVPAVARGGVARACCGWWARPGSSST
jgi:hypothetical protein